MVNNYLVGGWPIPLKNRKVSWDIILFPYMKWKKCSKPPTRLWLVNKETYKVVPQFGIAKLVQITPISLCFMVDISIVTMVRFLNQQTSLGGCTTLYHLWRHHLVVSTPQLRPWPFVITGYFYGMRNIYNKWGDFLVLITGITRAITAVDQITAAMCHLKPIKIPPSYFFWGKTLFNSSNFQFKSH